jgi:hypothetical protein
MGFQALFQTLLIDSSAAALAVHRRFTDLADPTLGRLSVLDVPSGIRRPNERLTDVYCVRRRAAYRSADTPMARRSTDMGGIVKACISRADDLDIPHHDSSWTRYCSLASSFVIA